MYIYIHVYMYTYIYVYRNRYPYKQREHIRQVYRSCTPICATQVCKLLCTYRGDVQI